MKWDDISPDLLAFVREPVAQDPDSDGISLPPEMAAWRKEWNEFLNLPLAASPLTEQVSSPPSASTVTDNPFAALITSHDRQEFRLELPPPSMASRIRKAINSRIERLPLPRIPVRVRAYASLAALVTVVLLASINYYHKFVPGSGWVTPVLVAMASLWIVLSFLAGDFGNLFDGDRDDD